MRIYLDDELIDDSGSTLAKALEAAAAKAGDRLLIGVSADGEPIPDAQLADPPVTEPFAAEIRFTSADPVSLVRVTLLEAADHLESSKEKQGAIAQQIQLGELSRAMPELSNVLDIWQQVEQCITLSRQVNGIELGHVNGEETFEQLAAQLTTRLGEIRDAISSRDLSTLADILAYDMDQQADAWTTVLRDLAAGCRASAA